MSGGRLGTHKDVERIARRARKRGWTVSVRKGSTHLRWVGPDGQVVITALTPRSPNAVLRTLRKAGLD